MKKIILMILLLAVCGYGEDSTLTVCAEGCDYTTLEAALDANECDLTTVERRFVFHITGGINETSPSVSVNNYTNPTADYYIYIYTSGDGRPDNGGLWDDTAYRIIAAGNCLTVHISYTVIDGIQVDLTYLGDAQVSAVVIEVGTEITFRNSIVRYTGSASNDQYGIRTDLNTATYYIYNNLVYDFNAADVSMGLFIEAADSSGYVYNNTICNSDIGIYAYANDCVAKNNIIWGCTLPVTEIAFGTGTGWNATDSSALAYSNSAGNDSVDAVFSFNDAGGDDWTLTAEFAGTDLSSDPHLPFSTDGLGNNRTVTWCAGFHEYDAAAEDRRLKLINILGGN